MGRGMRASKQIIAETVDGSMNSASAVDLQHEIQLLVEGIKERPVVSLSMVFPTIGVVNHG